MAVDDDPTGQLSRPVAQSIYGFTANVPSEDDGLAPRGEPPVQSQPDAQLGEGQADDSFDARESPGIGVDDAETGAGTVFKPSRRAVLGAAVSSPVRLASVVGLGTVLALAGLGGWLGVRAYHTHQDDKQRNLFLQVCRQGALNLTTIDYQHVDGDIQRILNSATGAFYDDFSKRAQPFVDVVKQAQTKSVGTVTEAGLESETGNDAQILVAVAVKTSNAGAPEQDPRAWRMRISVTRIGAEAKVSNVEFVP
jgi:Mce-associated membrane protein